MLISIGKVSWKLVFPIIYSIGVFCRKFSFYFPPKSPFLTQLLIIASQLLVGLLELVSFFRYREKSLITNKDTFEDPNDFNFLKKKKEFNLINILIPFCLGFISLYLVHFIMIRDVNIKGFTFERETYLFGLIYCICLEHFIFYKHMYRHKKLSLTLIIVLTFIISVIWILFPFKKMETKTSDILVEICFLIVTEVFFVTKHNIEKYLMDKRYLSPFKLVFIEGIGGLFCFFVIMLFYDYIGCYNIFKSCQKVEYLFPFTYLKESFSNYQYILIFLSFSLLVDIFIILTLKYFSPIFRPMFDMIWVFISFVFNLNRDIEAYGIFLFGINIVLYLLIIVSELIYTEIVVLNFWKFDKDINNQIYTRAIEDYNEEKEALFELINEIKKNKGKEKFLY